MENPLNRRDQAIKIFNDKIADANQKAAQRQANIRTQEQRRQRLYEIWPQIADGPIAHAVIAVSDDFVNHGSPVLLVPTSTSATLSSSPQRQADKNMLVKMDASPRSYDVRHGGQSQALARLQFEIDVSTGKISATTTAKGAELPLPVLMEEFEPQWAIKATEAVLLAVLES